MLHRIRAFFSTRKVLEVTTPVVSQAGNPDPQLQSYKLGCSNSAAAWLRTSPEFFHKRLLAEHGQDIYELGPVFRRGEAGRYHNPEFTLLEWYRVGWDYRKLTDEVVELIRVAGDGKFDEWPIVHLSYQELFRRYAGLDPQAATRAEIMDSCRDWLADPDSLSRTDLLDLLLTHQVQPSLPQQAITVVFDYPADQAALAKLRPGSPPVAERFEVYLGRQELANGYQELTNADEQRRRFQEECQQRDEAGLSEVTIDENFLSALEHGMPECAGVALGVDRLLMAVTGARSIEAVMAFPADRA